MNIIIQFFQRGFGKGVPPSTMPLKKFQNGKNSLAVPHLFLSEIILFIMGISAEPLPNTDSMHITQWKKLARGTLNRWWNL